MVVLVCTITIIDSMRGSRRQQDKSFVGLPSLLLQGVYMPVFFVFQFLQSCITISLVGGGKNFVE